MSKYRNFRRFVLAFNMLHSTMFYFVGITSILIDIRLMVFMLAKVTHLRVIFRIG